MPEMQRESGMRDPRTLVMALCAVAFVVGVAFWALLGPNPDTDAADATAQPTAGASAVASPSASQAPVFGPELVTAAGVADLANQVTHPVFWAGKIPNTELEVTIGADDSFELRYLPEGAKAGDANPTLTVVSWPSADAYNLVKDASTDEGVRTGTKGDSIFLARPETPDNAYLAVKGVGTLAEVFSPQADVAWTTVSTGGLTQSLK